MNILLINYEFPPLGGGGGIFSSYLAEELAREHTVDVLTTRFRDLPKTETKGSVSIHRVGVLNRTSLYHATMPSMLTFPVTATIKGLGLFREKKYDIINTHFAVPSGPCGIMLSEIFNVPNVLSLHGSDIYNPARKTSPHKLAPFRWAVRSALRQATKVVAQSTDIKKYAKELYSPGREISVIPLGFPPADFTLKPREENDKFHIVSMGRMAKVKGYDILIKAVEILKEKKENVYLTLIGDGQERANLEKLTFGSDLKNYVKFTGWVMGEEKFQYLSANDLYVMSSLHEGFGVVLLEAMTCGLPIVATNEGGQTDIIEHDKNGLLVRPGNAEEIAEAILSMKQNANKRHTIGEYNKEYVKKYWISNTAKQYVELFKEAIKL